MTDVDIKKAILEIANTKEINRYKGAAIEKIVCTMLQDYLQKEKKGCLLENRYVNHSYDLLLPDGIKHIKGRTAVEIKCFRQEYIPYKRIFDVIKKTEVTETDIDVLLFIFANEVSEKTISLIKSEGANLNFCIEVWDIDDLVDVFKQNVPLFVETIKNMPEKVISDTIRQNVNKSDSDFQKIRQTYIDNVKDKYDCGDVVLFLGAGASKAAGITMWKELISELHMSLINKFLENDIIQMNEKQKIKASKYIASKNDVAPLLQTRLLRKAFNKEFESILKDILYKNCKWKSTLLDEIALCCDADSGKVSAIVNYNFDDLVETTLKVKNIPYASIYNEDMAVESGTVGIYHVHGFLPQKEVLHNDLTEPLLVFAEEGYHKLMIDPYNWANLVQLNYMTNNTCVFIGMSMTDPNLRRLLDIVAQKRIDSKAVCKHYAIMQKSQYSDKENGQSIISFNKTIDSLQAALLEELGVSTIWIEKFSEIPNILREIRNDKGK